MKNSRAQQGFTLIELVVVIVILGILAVTAAPKFIDLQSDAKTATLDAVKASLQSASTLVHSKALIKGNADVDGDGGDTPTVTVNGQAVEVTFGYPRSDSGSAASWTANLLDVNSDDFTTADDAISGTVVVYPANGTEPTGIPADPKNPTSSESNCFAFYTEPTGAGTVPTINSVPCL